MQDTCNKCGKDMTLVAGSCVRCVLYACTNIDCLNFGLVQIPAEIMAEEISKDEQE